MVKAPRNRLGHGEDKKPSSNCHDLDLDQDWPPALAPVDHSGGTGGPGNGSVLGLGVPCPGQDPPHPRVDPPGKFDASQGDRCLISDGLFNCQGPENPGPGGRKA